MSFRAAFPKEFWIAKAVNEVQPLQKVATGAVFNLAGCLP